MVRSPRRLRFHRSAFLALFDQQSHYKTAAEFARANEISPGTFHDITQPDSTGAYRREPSDALIRKLAAGLKVPVAAIVLNPEEPEAKAS